MRSKVLMFVLAFLVVLPALALADFAEGKKSYDNKNWRRAIVLLRPLVEQGDARAMVLMGNMYAEGHGVEKDTTEAFLLYRRAAERNSVDGMLATATLYQAGEGIPVNTQLAILWFERCAKLGNQACAFFYATHLYQGSKGVTYDFKPDHAAAYKWYRITARGRGNPKMAKMADMLAEKLKTELDYKAIDAADAEVVAWSPVSAQDIGPLPEEIVNNAAPETQGDAAPEVPAPAPEATGQPAPEQKPE